MELIDTDITPDQLQGRGFLFRRGNVMISSQYATFKIYRGTRQYDSTLLTVIEKCDMGSVAAAAAFNAICAELNKED